MEKPALVILLLALGTIIFEFAVFSVVKANNPWLKALPALVPFIGLIATVFFSVAKDAWMVELAKFVNKMIRLFPPVLYLSTILTVAVSISFGHYVWQIAGAKEGQFIVQVIQKDDVPDQYVSGLPVILDQKLKSEVLEHATDKFGKASFEVDVNDVFALRLLESANKGANTFVVTSNAQVSDKTKKGFQLVQLAGIPATAWIRSSKTVTDQNFAQFPAMFLRWHDNGRAQHVINVNNADPIFPFALPGAETVIKREAFSIGFSPLLRLPRWVAYKVVPGEAIKRNPDNFLPDPALPSSYQASSSDYRGNDFDRGHLVRRSDMFGFGKKATSEVFYLSAIVPQLDYVNQKTWLTLEVYTSEKATTNNNVYVIRGPIYEPVGDGRTVNVTLMGANLIPVPTHFFQVLFITSQEGNTVEAHIVPNTYIPFEDKDLTRFRTSVQSIVQKTGLRFDAKLLQ
jgi:endonuclease G, mitochondrial